MSISRIVRPSVETSMLMIDLRKVDVDRFGSKAIDLPRPSSDARSDPVFTQRSMRTKVNVSCGSLYSTSTTPHTRLLGHG